MHISKSTKRKGHLHHLLGFLPTRPKEIYSRKSLLPLYILWAPHSPTVTPCPQVRGQRWKARLQPASPGGEELVLEVPFAQPLSLVYERRNLLLLLSSCTSGCPQNAHWEGKQECFYFPGEKKNSRSETTELKHREASWALTQPAAQRVRSFSTLSSSFSCSSSRTKCSY